MKSGAPHSELVRSFEDGEAALQLPLFRGALVVLQECRAVCSGLAGGGDGSGADGLAPREVIGRRPQAFAVEEGMLERGAGGALEIEVGEALLFGGFDVLVGKVDAGDAFVVGG